MPKCPHCEKPTSDKSVTCAHCGGHIDNRVQRAPHQTITCPRCDAATDVVTLGSVQLDLCRSCRGLWFDRPELREFSEDASDESLNRQLTEMLRELRQRVSLPPAKAYLACPVCAARMQRTDYVPRSAIVLYACVHHGTWADHAAAVRLVQFLGTGDAEKLREMAELHEKRELERKVAQVRTAHHVQADQLARLDLRGRIHIFLDWFDIL